MRLTSDQTTFSAADWAALKFTVFQAAYSAILSVFFGFLLAQALFRQSFRGRQLLVLMLGAPFILPVLVAILGLLSVFGHNGLVNTVITAIGLKTWSIYGIQGILLAHVYLNMPLATRFFLQGLESIPQERWRLAQALSLKKFIKFRVIEWPVIQKISLQAFVAIFVVCLTSFAIILTLGGGPRATTIEVAIYQAIRLDLDFSKAAILGLSQFTLTGVIAMLALWFLGNGNSLSGGLDRPKIIWNNSIIRSIMDWLIIIVFGLFLFMPIYFIFMKGIGNLTNLGPSVWSAAFNSLLMAITSSIISLTIACPLTHKWGEALGTLGIAVSPLVIGAGLFILIRPIANPFDYALYVTVLVNAIMGLPFAIRILRPAAEDIRQDYLKLSKALSLNTIGWVYWIFLPRLRKPLGYAGGLVAALSMGDLGIIALFGGAEFTTLPLKIYQLMGAYRMDQALSASLILLILSFALFFIFENLGRRSNV